MKKTRLKKSAVLREGYLAGLRKGYSIVADILNEDDETTGEVVYDDSDEMLVSADQDEEETTVVVEDECEEEDIEDEDCEFPANAAEQVVEAILRDRDLDMMPESDPMLGPDEFGMDDLEPQQIDPALLIPEDEEDDDECEYCEDDDCDCC